MSRSPLLLALVAMSFCPAFGDSAWTRVHVDCADAGLLTKTLAMTGDIGNIEIYLDGVCEGNFVIQGGRVIIRGATPNSGISAPIVDPPPLPVLNVINADVSLRDMVIQGGMFGLLVEGSDAEVLLASAEVLGQSDIGVGVKTGGSARILRSTIRESPIGVAVWSGADVLLDESVVADHQTGVISFDRSYVSLLDTVVSACGLVGLQIADRSEGSVTGGRFFNNGQLHVHVSDRSDVQLYRMEELGSADDPTDFALGAVRHSRVSSYTTPVITGSVYLLDEAAIRLGSTNVRGDLLIKMFSNAYVRGTQIDGLVGCWYGSDAVCRFSTSGEQYGCPSRSCGAGNLAEDWGVLEAPEFPDVKVPCIPSIGRSSRPSKDCSTATHNRETRRPILPSYRSPSLFGSRLSGRTRNAHHQ